MKQQKYSSPRSWASSLKKLFVCTTVLGATFGHAAGSIDYIAGDTYEEPEYAPGEKAPKIYTKSMETRDERVEWWVDGRFGCFIHWGVYAQLGGVWKGEPVSGYSEHIQRKHRIDQATYAAETASKFNPTGFNAEEWVKLIKAAGMRYLIITAKHHDGFAMYDSKVSAWNIIDATPFDRDPMTELKAACVKHDIKFGFYYSHAFDWGEPDGPGNDWEFQNPGGDHLFGGRHWWEDPVWSKELPRIRENYVNKKSIPQVIELLENYQPDIMWFDTPHKLPNSENWRIYKVLREISPDVVVNGRMISGYGDYKTTCDKPVEIKPTSYPYWEAIPTTNESYGYHSEDKSHKPASEQIRLLIKAVARGGNILMNLGPRADGKIDDPDVTILQELAAWMSIGAESIHGAGKSGLPVQAWGESTAKGDTTYLQVFNWPEDGKLRIGGLKNSPTAIRILGGSATVRAKRINETTLELTLPAKPVSEISTVIALQFEGLVQTSSARLLDSTQATYLSVFDSKIQGKKLTYGRGAKGSKERGRHDCLVNWSNPKDSTTWEVYANSEMTYDVSAVYHGNENGNSMSVKLGGDEIDISVRDGQDIEVTIGQLRVQPGVHTLELKAGKYTEGEIANPRALIFTPVSQ